MPALPCRNPSCKSYGRPHPNCKCYNGGNEFADGGFVCSGSHQEKCQHFADGGEVQENTLIHNNPNYAIDHVAVNNGLLGLMTKIGHHKFEDSSKHMEHFVDSAKKGIKTIKSRSKDILSSEKFKSDKNDRESLKNHLQDLRENPEKMLDIGGALGDHLPDHSIQLSAKAGNAINHFDSIKPMQHQNRPMDSVTPIDQRDEQTYDKHLDLANNPSIILNSIKEGKLIPSQVMTLKSLYPTLYKSMVDGVGEAIIDAKTKNVKIPYKQKMSMSLFIGEPLDSTMTPQSMQAIIKSAGPQQARQQLKKNQKSDKASGVELNQINKVNQMDTTKLQDREMNKKD